MLDDAVAAAAVAVAERSRLETDAERAELAEIIGISAVKFTELAHHRLSDYVFDLDKMLALQGDTAPYLQNSVVRCRSIFRKLEEQLDLSAVAPVLDEDAEIHLARHLARCTRGACAGLFCATATIVPSCAGYLPVQKQPRPGLLLQ